MLIVHIISPLITLTCLLKYYSYDLVHKDIHMQTHNGDEVFRCGSCNITFANKLHLDMHMAAKQKPRVVSTLDLIIFTLFILILS